MLSQKDFEFIARIIYEESGIIFKDNKKYFIENRVLNHMEDLNILDIDKYLITLRRGGTILDDFISKITTNETYFYREFYHLKLLAKNVQEDNFRPPLKLLSFPTSSGEEPYSMAIVLNEVLGYKKMFTIVGCDIDRGILDKAREGIYNERSIGKLPKPYLDRYFRVLSRDRELLYKINDDIKNRVIFKKGSIIDRDFVRSLGKFHYIFCKNLLIYFDEVSKERAINNLYDALHDNGLLLLGHAETISKTTALFEPVKIDDTIVYRKIDEDE